jgi:hypothetical protein
MVNSNVKDDGLSERDKKLQQRAERIASIVEVNNSNMIIYDGAIMIKKKYRTKEPTSNYIIDFIMDQYGNVYRWIPRLPGSIDGKFRPCRPAFSNIIKLIAFPKSLPVWKMPYPD